MKHWRTGKPKKSGEYYVIVRWPRHGDLYSETSAVFSTNLGGIWGNMNIPSNTFEEVVKWMPLEEAKNDICLKCKHGYRDNPRNYEVFCMIRKKETDECNFEAKSSGLEANK